METIISHEKMLELQQATNVRHQIEVVCIVTAVKTPSLASRLAYRSANHINCSQCIAVTILSNIGAGQGKIKSRMANVHAMKCVLACG